MAVKDAITEQKLRGFSTVRVSKSFLIETLEKNKEDHQTSYYEILEARHAKLLDTLRGELKKAKDRKDYQPSIHVPLPENHVKDYEKVINLLHASLDQEFELSRSEFDQYVNDDWGWKGHFLTVSGCYIPTVSS
jgi:hypothetical protein